MIAHIGHMAKESDPSYLVTNLEDDGQELYEKLYCARGEMENRIKEQHLDPLGPHNGPVRQRLFADSTSSHKWWPNQFRVLLSGLAYPLLEIIRRISLAGNHMA